MINPNISKYVTVTVLNENNPRAGLWAEYRGELLPIFNGYKKPGRRRYWLKYSITMDTYYLTDRAPR